MTRTMIWLNDGHLNFKLPLKWAVSLNFLILALQALVSFGHEIPPAFTPIQSSPCFPPSFSYYPSYTCKLFIWHTYWIIIHSVWNYINMITTVKHALWLFIFKSASRLACCRSSWLLRSYSPNYPVNFPKPEYPA